MYSRKSTIGDIMKNPLGEDVITTITEQVGLPYGAIHNPLTKSLTLNRLQRLSKGAIDDAFIQMFCSKMNEYEGLRLPLNHGPVKPMWWKEAIAYQIYPRSFMDSNGDGVGDLQGIISKLDYLKGLGVDLLWLSPIYDSPNDDNGYDIRDYYKIMEEFGTMEDFDALLSKAHELGIRLIMDLVVNHTSDEHQWFKEAMKSKDNPFRDYYIWKEARGRKQAPNNWRSFFSGSAWRYFKETDSYGLHLFTKKQMDLNWDHQPLRQSVYDMIRFWLDKGIDGFRLDVINYISKEEGLPDGSKFVGDLMGHYGVEYYFLGPHLHDYLQEMNRETFGKYDVVTVGETPGIGINISRLLTHEDRHELDMVFSFEHLDQIGKSRQDSYVFDLNHLKQIFIKWQTGYGSQCWNSIFYDNHDNPRMLSKVDPEGLYRKELGKLLGLLQMTLKGTPFIYQGQELGLVNGIFETIEDYRDVESINLYKELMDKGVSEANIMETLHASTRDHARIVMPWTDEPGGGFTTGEPWIKASIADSTINCAAEMKEADSVYNFYKKIIGLRKNNIDLIYGAFEVVHREIRDYFAYYRHGKEKTFFVDMNLSSQIMRPKEKTWQYKQVLTNYPTPSLMLRPYECRLFEVEK